MGNQIEVLAGKIVSVFKIHPMSQEGSCGLMDKALGFEPRDCGFESRHDLWLLFLYIYINYLELETFPFVCVFWTKEYLCLEYFAHLFVQFMICIGCDMI